MPFLSELLHVPQAALRDSLESVTLISIQEKDVSLALLCERDGTVDTSEKSCDINWRSAHNRGLEPTLRGLESWFYLG